MRLTTKGRYAVTAMLDLALYGEQGPISLADVSSRQDISLSYLEQLFAKLRRKDLVQSVRGPGGGYRLTKPLEEIYVAEIIDAVDERVDATGCAGNADCHGGTTCLTHHLWADLSDKIHHFLSDISLASLVQSNNVQSISARQRQAELEASFAGDKISLRALES
ncbi:Fe-S cluster assembly transcriptional regulator IscR [Spongiibacter sp. KMU-158]|uniref:Fe-S cluster assembly transcriptional regulator IscR n=1 Tax=Spongiibacter pelagi TaxID=2760804 RepID=A0A927GWC1_9GAMM|nr:Fe-S cluster assembly transcriptional regulator IscR [Spongiibacter pelagi]MBD2858274.1 Fe-S cluster assembly transcriptional regulator IscR [Spongiibacter pelagi]